MLEAFVGFCSDRKIEYSMCEPMKKHTTFKIGGNADIMVFPADFGQLSEICEKAKELKLPVFILGNGSNLLVSDAGIEGVVVSLLRLCDITCNGDKITASAGAMLSAVCTGAKNNSLSGLEFAYGIPGTVGGALFMNAGAYGGEMKDAVLSADALLPDGSVKTFLKDEMALGYRTSIFKKNGAVILSVTFKLSGDEKSKITARMDDFLCRRKSKQPLEFPSAGSTFKRPEGNFAGTLIEKNGLKGFSIGGAEVSQKHAGFVINKGNATCKDVLSLMDEVEKRVFCNDGVKLEPEVIFVGRR